MDKTTIDNWARAYTPTYSGGRIKQFDADFQVEEELSFPISGEGDHLYLYIKKQNANTQWVAEMLAKKFGLKLKDIGYAGLKDKNAITKQWFSLHLPGKNHPQIDDFPQEVVVLDSTRHQKKIRRGAIKENRFEIIVRDVSVKPSEIEIRLQEIAKQGVPNYFGEQRFGKHCQNIEKFRLLITRQLRVKKHQRGIYISSARSYLFNEILSERVKQQTWNKLICGDVATLNNTHSIFSVPMLDETLESRVDEMDIHPSGVLWGEGATLSSGNLQVLESLVINQHSDLSDGLINMDAKLSYRSLRVRPANLTWDLTNNNLHLNFSLPTGSYATSILREIFLFD